MDNRPPSNRPRAGRLESNRPIERKPDPLARPPSSNDQYRLRVVLPVGFAALAVALGLFVALQLALKKPAVRKQVALPDDPAGTFPKPSPVAPLPSPPASAAVALSRSHTTMAILSAQGPDCLDCAQRSGCLDTKGSGNPCEGATGNATACGAGVTETDMCLRTLMQVFSSKCAATLQQVPCLCGATDAQECLQGTAQPSGPLYGDYVCDFKTADVAAIQTHFRDPSFGAGIANTLVQCAAESECKCFGSDDKN
jgi:hypothetical protein